MYQRIEAPSPHKCAKAIKIMNIVTGVIIIAFGLVGILFMALMHILSGKFFLIFSPMFQMLFGVILVAAEFKFEQIMKYFGFLKQFSGRGIFNIYLSTSVYFYFSCGNGNEILAWVASMTLFGIGIIYLILHFAGGSNAYYKDLAEELE